MKLHLGSILLVAACHHAPSATTPPPAGATPTAITWLVTNEQPEESLRHRVQLRVGEHLYDLPEQKGGLMPENQAICGNSQYPKVNGEISKIVFYIGGASGFTAKHESPGAIRIHQFQATDGLCSPGECPDTDKIVATIAVPRDATFTDAIEVSEPGSAPKPFACR
jgi:hypothetical protein